MKSEALISVGSVTALIAALIVLARSFGVPLDDNQQNALLGFVAVAGPFVVGIVGRQFVFSQDTTENLVAKAAQTGKPNIGTPPTGK